jgi:tellurite resistance protein
MDVDEIAASVIAAGMRAVAKADGEVHARELELIEGFASGLPNAVATASGRVADEQIAATYLRSLVMVALADGVVSPVERTVIVRLAAEMGVDEARVDAEIGSVKRQFLKEYAQRNPLRHRLTALASELGLPEAEVDAALSEGAEG